MYKLFALLKRLFLASIILFLSGFIAEAGGRTFNAVWDTARGASCGHP